MLNTVFLASVSSDERVYSEFSNLMHWPKWWNKLCKRAEEPSIDVEPYVSEDFALL